MQLHTNISDKGIFIYYIIFVLFIPYVLLMFNNDLIKFYLLLLLPIAIILKKINRSLYNNIYSNTPNKENQTQQYSTYIILFITLLSILWSVHYYTCKYDLIVGLIFGIFVVIQLLINDTTLDKLLNWATKICRNYNFATTYNLFIIIFSMMYLIVFFMLQLLCLLLLVKNYKHIDNIYINNTSKNNNHINELLSKVF